MENDFAIKVGSVTRRFDNLTAVDNLSCEGKTGASFGVLGFWIPGCG